MNECNSYGRVVATKKISYSGDWGSLLLSSKRCGAWALIADETTIEDSSNTFEVNAYSHSAAVCKHKDLPLGSLTEMLIPQ